MGRANFEKAALRAKRADGHRVQLWKRERPTRRQAPPPTLNVDVHGVLFVIIAAVFVVYPLAQWALGQ